LFRAWSSRSGGGSSRTINSITEIVPRRFTPGAKKSVDFYGIKEDLLHQLALQHFEHSGEVITGFSSWAASLHLVLCYAKSMDPRTNPNVAVIDTHELDTEVLVWQCSHLLGKGYHEEYLAWGCIRGRGYKAVSLKELEALGIFDIFSVLRMGLTERRSSSNLATCAALATSRRLRCHVRRKCTKQRKELPDRSNICSSSYTPH
jgi:hypothetical protein